MHRVAIIAYDSVVAAEVTMLAQVFATANLQLERPGYEIRVVGNEAPVTTSTLYGPSFTLVPDRGLSWAATADTVVIPAHESFLDPAPSWVGDVLLAAYARKARVASLCVGAFILASTGLLDGRPATTHWQWADELAARFPAVLLQREKLFVGQDGVYTGAGVTASLDLALHLVEQDRGAAVSAGTARFIVAPMRREGGQAQFVEYDTPRRAEALQDTLRWAEVHLADDLTVTDLARRAHMSPRTFTRRFRAGTGATPMDWLLRTRVRRAKELLETTTWPIERIASECGFRATSTFRHHFVRVTTVTPARYRRTFGPR